MPRALQLIFCLVHVLIIRAEPHTLLSQHDVVDSRLERATEVGRDLPPRLAPFAHSAHVHAGHPGIDDSVSGIVAGLDRDVRPADPVDGQASSRTLMRSGDEEGGASGRSRDAGPGLRGTSAGKRRRARLFSSVNFNALDRLAHGGPTGPIPHVIHQNFMGGRGALEREVLKPHSYFRRDWWRSCQVR